MIFKGFKIESDGEHGPHHITKVNGKPFKVYGVEKTSEEYMGTIGMCVDFVNAIWQGERAEKAPKRVEEFDSKRRTRVLEKRAACVAELEAAIEAKDMERFRTEWYKHRSYLTCKQAGPLYRRMIAAAAENKMAGRR